MDALIVIFSILAIAATFGILALDWWEDT